MNRALRSEIIKWNIITTRSFVGEQDEREIKSNNKRNNSTNDGSDEKSNGVRILPFRAPLDMIREYHRVSAFAYIPKNVSFQRR